MTDHIRTGLVCQTCKRPVVQIENRTPTGFVFHCPACDHRWSAREPGTLNPVVRELLWMVGCLVPAALWYIYVATHNPGGFESFEAFVAHTVAFLVLWTVVTAIRLTLRVARAVIGAWNRTE